MSNALHLHLRHQSQQVQRCLHFTWDQPRQRLDSRSRPCKLKLLRRCRAMNAVNFNQGTSLAGRTTVLCLLVGATAACLWFRFPLARSKHARSPAKPTSDSTRSTRRGVHLCQVHPDKDEADTDIDIIAIHGLDTKSPDTWTWVNRQSCRAARMPNRSCGTRP